MPDDAHSRIEYATSIIAPTDEENGLSVPLSPPAPIWLIASKHREDKKGAPKNYRAKCIIVTSYFH
jgi:hypothetical protein